MMKIVVSLMWIVGMAILLSAILVHDIWYLIFAIIVGDALAISSVALEEKLEAEKCQDPK